MILLFLLAVLIKKLLREFGVTDKTSFQELSAHCLPHNRRLKRRVHPSGLFGVISETIQSFMYALYDRTTATQLILLRNVSFHGR